MTPSSMPSPTLFEDILAALWVLSVLVAIPFVFRPAPRFAPVATRLRALITLLAAIVWAPLLVFLLAMVLSQTDPALLERLIHIKN